jgi:LCP family protein required for cell wall assembly
MEQEAHRRMEFESLERNTDRREQRSPYTYLTLFLIFAVIAACIAGGEAYARVSGTLREISSSEDVRLASRRLSQAAERAAEDPLQHAADRQAEQDPAARATPAPLPTAAPAERAEAPALTRQPFTVLLIGTDVRDDPREPSVRSDTLILARVDPETRWAALLSIPRDTLVTIPSEVCGGRKKINAAYACGYLHPTQYGPKVKPEDAGAALAAETVEALLGVPVDYTAQIDFRGFERVIDAIGGITIDVPRTIVDPAYPTEDYGTIEIVFKAGRQRMDGRTALQYARTRHADSDFGRIDRQQQVLMAALQQFRARGLLAQLGSASRLLDIVSDSVRTTLPLNDLRVVYALADLADEIGVERVQRLSLQPGQNRNGEPNLRMGSEDSIIWKPWYIEQVVDEFLLPGDNLASAR